MKKIIFILLSHFCFFLPRADGHGHHHDHDHEEFHWTKKKSEYAELETQIAGPSTIKNFITVSGKIIFHPDHLAYVFPRASGTIFQVRKNLGDRVEKDEILAMIESKEIAEAKAHFIRALKRYRIRQVLLNREECLRGISTEHDLLIAQLDYEDAAIDLECATQLLYTLGLTQNELCALEHENAENRRLYALKAPMKGRILERHLTLGELVSESSKAFEIGNFETIWIEINISQNDVRFLKEGLLTEIDGFCSKRATARICQFNPTISEETRMATAIAAMENRSEKWTPGEFVKVRIQTEATRVPLAVCREAVQKMKGEDFVFVEEADTFVPRKVKLGIMDDSCVEILSGLKEGECYAACNAFCLKAEHEKEEGEHSH